MSLSLRSFHVFFIAVSILLALWVGAWGMQIYLEERSLGGLALGVASFLVGFVLVVYFVRVRKKLKDLGPEE